MERLTNNCRYIDVVIVISLNINYIYFSGLFVVAYNDPMCFSPQIIDYGTFLVMSK